jgi:TonB-linked outer membrane protein, SusC/RagA family
MKKIIINLCNVLFFSISLLNVVSLQAQEKDSTVNVAFGTIAKQDMLGAVSTVNVSDLMKKDYSTYSLDGMQSFIGGYNGGIWGQGALVLVDGIPRNASDIRSSEVESVTVLKGANAIVLYGSRAAKGAILITTKRGAIKPLTIEVRANSGLYVPKAYPKYLNSADYMTLYNEACRNDGVTEKYAQSEIDNTSAGVNPYRYPNIDFFNSKYLKNAYNKTDLTAEISGGNERARYYTNYGMSYNNSLMNYGYQKNNSDYRFNIRANVDMNLSKWLKASTDAVAVVSNNYSGRGDFWGSSASVRPNKYSAYVPINMFDPNNSTLQTLAQNSNHLIDGQYLLGGSSTDLTNTFSDMLAAGYIKNRNRTFMFDVKVDADLGAILKGLSFNTAYSVDYIDAYSEAWQVGYAVYQPTWNATNDTITGLKKFNDDTNSTSEYIGNTSYSQTMSLKSQFNYIRTFGKDHNVTATLLGWGYQTQKSSDPNHTIEGVSAAGSMYHRLSNLNLGFQATYNYRHKYYLDFSAAEVHSAKFAEGHRDAFSPTITLGWRISDEGFIKNNAGWINNLKLTASYANLHQDIDISDYYLYKGYYDNKGGWYQWHDGSAGGWTTGSKRGDNVDLTFIQREEYRVGLEGSLFNNAITFDANYFKQNTNGLLSQGYTLYPSYFTSWDYSYLPYLNYNNDQRKGADFAVNFNKKVGQVQCSLGFTGMYLETKAMRRDEVYSDAYLYSTGKPLDASWGLTCQGFYTQADVDAIDGTKDHPKSSFGTVRAGDLKYEDVNGDGIVDAKDQTYLGHYSSPMNFGVNLTLKWNQFTLFAMGTANVGGIAYKNSSYYWVYGDRKYSDVVWGRWTDEATASSATYPRLTTTANSNNFINSTFWMYKTDRFDLSRVQITYDFKESLFKNSFIHGLNTYVSGENLLTLAKERKLMETNIGSAPQCRFFNVGLKATF